MPVSAIEIVKKLMAKAGVTTTDPLTGDVPDEVATALDNQLLTVAIATNNHPDVKKVYFAQAYNGMDAEIKNLYTEFGLTDDVVAEIEKAGGSVKKAAALARKIKEIGEKNVPADPNKAKELQNTITELNNKLAAEIKKQTDLQTDFDKKVKDIQLQTWLDSMTGGYKTIYDEVPEARGPAVQALINKALQDSDAQFAYDDKGKPTVTKKDGTNLFGENHTLVTPQSFIDKSLSKILKVTDPNQGKVPAPKLPGQQSTQPNTALTEALQQSLSSYQEAAKVAI